MAVIKQAEGIHGVRQLAGPPPLTAILIDPRDEAIALLQAERDTLAAQLAEAGDRIARADTQARDHIGAAREEALSEGRRAGLAAAETREAERVAAIARGVTQALAQFDARLSATEGLAAALARACLDRVFAQPDATAAMVTQALARHFATLRDDAVVTVRVSGADFSDGEALAAAVRDGARATVAIDRHLPSGACRVEARLGQVALDVPEQWSVLARLLDEMAAA
ncbi:hypothetical protein KV697_11510 [Sphingomonas sanguinis]|uniref:FliH/SctL family protein n=1 Tax=Sphingomonas sanguinis TaxID=33051 RepID=UPI001C56B9CE|nr:FliH/SctL family protein [Sphingomonas sanguinis]QXT34450.1 hypothetical protein KV697_11510 [Sphingomonas sanguinis]